MLPQQIQREAHGGRGTTERDVVQVRCLEYQFGSARPQTADDGILQRRQHDAKGKWGDWVPLLRPGLASDLECAELQGGRTRVRRVQVSAEGRRDKGTLAQHRRSRYAIECIREIHLGNAHIGVSLHD
jgi:hypothetical protein